LGKLLEHPEIMTQGETIEELEENIKDAYLLMTVDDVPEEYQTKGITVRSVRSLFMNLWIDTAREFGDTVPEPKGRRLMLA
jgi:hypothetical protein